MRWWNSDWQVVGSGEWWLADGNWAIGYESIRWLSISEWQAVSGEWRGMGLVADGKWRMVSEQSFMCLLSDSVDQSGECVDMRRCWKRREDDELSVNPKRRNTMDLYTKEREGKFNADCQGRSPMSSTSAEPSFSPWGQARPMGAINHRPHTWARQHQTLANPPGQIPSQQSGQWQVASGEGWGVHGN